MILIFSCFLCSSYWSFIKVSPIIRIVLVNNLTKHSTREGEREEEENTFPHCLFVVPTNHHFRLMWYLLKYNFHTYASTNLVSKHVLCCSLKRPVVCRWPMFTSIVFSNRTKILARFFYSDSLPLSFFSRKLIRYFKYFFKVEGKCSNDLLKYTSQPIDVISRGIFNDYISFD